MNKSNSLKGKIQFVGGKSSTIKYSAPTMEAGFEDNICDTMMGSFENIKFSSEEKKQLSRSHRKIINYYRHLNPFSLNADAKQLISMINSSRENQFVIKANQYGAYICLAALYSGKLSDHKKVEFILENAPLALFPKALMKAKPKDRLHKIVLKLSEDSWLSPFTSLYDNQMIKYSFAKKSIKKAA